jgi:hypothetical protein
MLPVLGAYKVFRLLRAIAVFSDEESPVAAQAGGLDAERPPPRLASPPLTEGLTSESLESGVVTLTIVEPGHPVNRSKRLNP